MGKWKAQAQQRDAGHVTKQVEMPFDLSEEQIEDMIGTHLRAGWTLERTDSISFTMRSPTDANGDYFFFHYWRKDG